MSRTTLRMAGFVGLLALAIQPCWPCVLEAMPDAHSAAAHAGATCESSGDEISAAGCMAPALDAAQLPSRFSIALAGFVAAAVPAPGPTSAIVGMVPPTGTMRFATRPPAWLRHAAILI